MNKSITTFARLFIGLLLMFGLFIYADKNISSLPAEQTMNFEFAKEWFSNLRLINFALISLILSLNAIFIREIFHLPQMTSSLRLILMAVVSVVILFGVGLGMSLAIIHAFYEGFMIGSLILGLNLLSLLLLAAFYVFYLREKKKEIHS